MKITLTKLFDLNTWLSTDAGQELKASGGYLADFVNLLVRVVNKGINFTDNCDATCSTVELKHDEDQVIYSPKTVKYVLIGRPSYGDDMLDSYNWKYNTKNELVLKVKWEGSPTARVKLDLILMHS